MVLHMLSVDDDDHHHFMQDRCHRIGQSKRAKKKDVIS